MEMPGTYTDLKKYGEKKKYLLEWQFTTQRSGGINPMSYLFWILCTSLYAYSTSALFADTSLEPASEAMSEFPTMEAVQMPIEESIPAMTKSMSAESKAPLKKNSEKVPEATVNPFTGKIKGRKVRMRLRPDLDSRIIKELSKNELVVVIGEKEDFWAVQAPAGTKAYIFRSFVLDNVVEGNRVNIRLEPSLDAPVIGHLNVGDKIENPTISPVSPKWFEITPPPQTRFYIAKEYIEYVGGPEVKAQMDRRGTTAEQLIDASVLLSKAEMRKPFEEIDFDRVVRGFNTVITDYTDFPDLVEQAKESLTTCQETYLQKRIAHLESHPSEEYVSSPSQKSEEGGKISLPTDKMKLWEPIEEALYLSWANINDNKTQRDYFEEQKLAAVEISGIVEPYNAPVKNKPGDFILREKDIPVGYVYSTHVNLQNLVGKNVRLVATPRPNNNFAFPAYYVLAIE
jgi:hypothetical protein